MDRDKNVPVGDVMEKWVEWQRRLAPEAIKLTQERYGLWRELHHEGFRGRRALAQCLGVSERTARQHIEFLKNAGLVDSSNSGVTLTGDGESALEELNLYVRQLSGLSSLEKSLADAFGLSEVVVVPGDSDEDSSVLQELGRAGADILLHYLKPQNVIAVGGGSTLAQVAKGVHKNIPGIVVVPARGGLGETVEVQANTVASVLAHGLSGQYRMLHMPDGLKEKAINLVLEANPDMQEILELIQKADILIQGIGRSEDMANRRRVSSKLLKEIQSSGAVGEAMGYYFDKNGKVIHETGSVGMKLKDLNKVRFVLAVSGGKSKGEAILAVLRAGGQNGLITDEGAARQIIKLIAEKR